jgi:hypothetical protein
MTNRADNFEQLHDGRDVVTECVRRVNTAPALLEVARNAQFRTDPPDLYAEAARQAEAISFAQHPENGNVVPLNTQAVSNQAQLLARPSSEVYFGEAA